MNIISESELWEIVEASLKKGFAIEEPDDCGWTLLHHTANNRLAHIGKKLLEYKARLRKRSSIDSLPLIYSRNPPLQLCSQEVYDS